MGKPIKGSLERVLAQAGTGTQPDPKSGSAGRPNTQLPLQFIPQNYIAVPGEASDVPVYIAKEITLKGKNWTDTHYALAENGLFMPTPKIMVNHFMNVKLAAEGTRTLHDGSGSPILQPEAKEMWDYLSLADTNYRNTKGACWTWLDALFKIDPQTVAWFMETDHRVVQQGTNKELQGQMRQLKPHYEQKGLVELSFNDDGLATNASSHDQYNRGENMYFWRLENEKVARFGADSDRAGLDCDGDPTGSNSGLGVFACAEGTASQK